MTPLGSPAGQGVFPGRGPCSKSLTASLPGTTPVMNSDFQAFPPLPVTPSLQVWRCHPRCALFYS